MVSVGVLGASGYSGGELLRLLDGHPELEVGQVWANASAGQPLGNLHPHLATLAGMPVETFDASDVEVDFVFMALPHGQSANYAEQLTVPVVGPRSGFPAAG